MAMVSRRISVQVVPFGDVELMTTLPTRSMRTQYGAGLPGPAVWLDAPSVARRRWKARPYVVEANELAWSFLNPVASGIAPTNNLAQLAMGLLAHQWRQPPRLSALANQLQVSREHLSRVLRSTCGQPPAQWLRQYRISRAADLLESGQSIEDVTHSCGYCSTQHFIHSFSRVKGTTPARWLRQKKRGDR